MGEQDVVEMVQVAQRYLQSSLLVLCDEFMSAHVDASFLFRRRIYRMRRRYAPNQSKEFVEKMSPRRSSRLTVTGLFRHEKAAQ